MLSWGQQMLFAAITEYSRCLHWACKAGWACTQLRPLVPEHWCGLCVGMSGLSRSWVSHVVRREGV